jgi:hypothetical protein
LILRKVESIGRKEERMMEEKQNDKQRGFNKGLGFNNCL